MDLAGKVAIITGGGGGIGRAMAERFVGEGARVVIADVDGEAAATVAKALGDQAVSCRTDVSDAGDVQRLVDFAVSRYEGLDIMVNNAGVSGGLRRFLDDDLRAFER